MPITIPVNEIYGPTFQGEGVEIGKPCIFIRLHHCPVQCPGCDTSFTWNKTEQGSSMTTQDIMQKVNEIMQDYPHCGIVLSGGEPLLQYKNRDLVTMLNKYRQFTWVSLETSGFVSGKTLGQPGDRLRLQQFMLLSFTRVHWSPKVTPCLHGQHTEKELLAWSDNFFEIFKQHPERLAVKFVVRDVVDVDAVVRITTDEPRFRNHRIFLMPYGIEEAEVIENSKFCLDACAKHGFDLSPRLHTLLWGKKRGV